MGEKLDLNTPQNKVRQQPKFILMKKIIIRSLMMCSIGVSLISCEKDQVIEIATTELNFEKVSDYTLDRIPLLDNKQDVSALMKNPVDKDEEKLNKYLYEIGLATRALIKDQNFNTIILKMAKDSKLKTAYLLDLKKTAPEYYQVINENLAKHNLSLEGIAADMTHAPVLPNPKFPETVEIEKYVPAIFVPNLDAVDAHKQPLLSPNVEADCSNDPSIEDFIVTWYYTEDGEMNEILLGEETSLETSNPLFLIDHATLYTRDRDNDISEERRTSNINSGARAITRFDSKEIKIKTGYRQETGAGNNSEYAIIAIRIEAKNPGAGVIHWIYNSGRWKKIDEVKVREINQTLVRTTLHAPNWTPYANNRVYWNTFERDWNRGLKNLGEPTFDGRTAFLDGNMRYNGDWYAYIPSTLDNHATPFAWFGWNNSINFYSWKADYVVHKVE